MNGRVNVLASLVICALLVPWVVLDTILIALRWLVSLPFRPLVHAFNRVRNKREP